MRGKAVVFTAAREVVVREIQLPLLGPRDIELRVACSGISPGTERWILTDQYKGVTYPLVPGYQAAGVVVAAGEAVRRFGVGDRAVVLGTRVAETGLRAMWGAHAATVVCDENQAWAVPEAVSLAHAAQTVLPAVAHHGLQLGGCRRGDLVVVTGLGMVGQAVVQWARHFEAAVIATDVVPARVRLAADLGADEALLFDPGALVQVVKARRVEGADLVVDTSASPPALHAGFEVLHSGGRVVLQGYYPGLTPLDLFTPHVKELVFYNPTSFNPEDRQAALQLMASGGLNVAPLISHRVGPEEAPALFRRLWEKPSDVMAALIQWDEGQEEG